MANYYAKLVGFFPAHAFPSREARHTWLQQTNAVKEVIGADDAKQYAEDAGWMVCHFPAKPEPSWDDGGHVWYPVSSDEDGYCWDQETEWRRCDV